MYRQARQIETPVPVIRESQASSDPPIGDHCLGQNSADNRNLYVGKNPLLAFIDAKPDHQNAGHVVDYIWKSANRGLANPDDLLVLPGQLPN